MDLGIEGRRAVVAAASGGLGFATAQALAQAGAQVAICGHDRDRIERAAGEIGERAMPFVADVTVPEGYVELIDGARDGLGGPIDILVLNGPGPPAGTFAQTSLERYETALAQLVVPAVAACRHAVPEMRERGWGRIVAITSVAVRQPIPALILSNTARTGLTAFLKTLALEIAADGVTVNSVQPRAARDGARAHRVRRRARGRGGAGPRAAAGRRRAVRASRRVPVLRARRVRDGCRDPRRRRRARRAAVALSRCSGARAAPRRARGSARRRRA